MLGTAFYIKPKAELISCPRPVFRTSNPRSPVKAYTSCGCIGLLAELYYLLVFTLEP